MSKAIESLTSGEKTTMRESLSLGSADSVAFSKVNKVTITAPATSATLTIAEGKTINAQGNITTGATGSIDTSPGGSILTFANITTNTGGYITTGTGGHISTLAGGGITTGSGFLTGPGQDGIIAITNPASTQTFSGPNTFSTRPLSTDGSEPAATSLITLADAQARYSPHLERSIWHACNMAVGTTSTGASVTRSSVAGAASLEGSLAAATAITGSGVLWNITRGGMFGDGVSNAVDFRTKWTVYTRQRFIVATNGEFILGLSYNASLGKPTTTGSANNAGLRIWNNGGTVTAELWKQVAGTVSVSSSSAAAPLTSIPKTGSYVSTGDVLVWLENVGDGNLNCYMAWVADGASTPLRPESPLLTLSGVPSAMSSGYANITAAIFCSAAPLGVNTIFSASDAKFLHY